MSDSTDNIIVDTATRIFQDLCEPSTRHEAEQGDGLIERFRSTVFETQPLSETYEKQS